MAKSLDSFSALHSRRWLGWGVVFLGGLALISAGLAWVSSGFASLAGWGAFALAGLVSAALVGAAWALLQHEEQRSLPGWLAGLLAGAFLLRLFLGAVWFVALPVYGHGTDTERAGYVMADAHERDQAAWELGRSGESLAQAFTAYRKEDQYGGLLLLSAAVYRFAGGAEHQPLLMILISAAISSLAVPLGWAFAARGWGKKEAQLTAWGLALYPEAVLLGSSQMREALIIPLTIAAFYGLLRYFRAERWTGLAWMAGALVLCLPFSPPYVAILVGMLVLSGLFLSGSSVRGLLRRRTLWLVLGGLLVLVVAGIWLAGSQFAPESVSDPLSLARWWLKRSADWQAYLSERASGKIQALFDRTPEWTHTPVLLGYGVVQPFLPAALIAISEAPIWTLIQVWRAVGWAVLLPFLLYAPVRAFGRHGDSLSRALTLAVWLAVLTASFRGGADQWDNPRYRAAFAGLQIALAAWAWVSQRKTPDPLLRRTLVGVGVVFAWFIPWYLQRKFGFPWPVTDLFKTLGLGFASAFLLAIWDWTRPGRRAATGP